MRQETRTRQPKMVDFLIECPVCKTEISSSAPKCYLCGSKIESDYITRIAQERGIIKDEEQTNIRESVPEPQQEKPRRLERERAHEKPTREERHILEEQKPEVRELKAQPKKKRESVHEEEPRGLPVVEKIEPGVQHTTASETNPDPIISEPLGDDSEYLEALKNTLQREQRDIDILKTELEIKAAELKLFEDQEDRLKKLEQIKEMLDSTLIERDRLKDEVAYFKKRNDEMESHIKSLSYLENEVDRKEEFIQELLSEKDRMQEELKNQATLSEELEEKRSSIEHLKTQLVEMRERVEQVEACTRRDDQLKVIRMLLEKETKRKEKLETELRQLENIRNLLKKEKKEREMLQEELDERDREVGELEGIKELLVAEKKETIRLRTEMAKKAKIEDKLKTEENQRKSLEKTVKLREEKIGNLADQLVKLEEKVANLKKLENVLKDEREQKDKLRSEIDSRLKYIQNLEKRLTELEKAVPQVKCPACNKAIQYDAKTCPHCGATFEGELISIEGRGAHESINVEELQQRQQSLEKREREIEELYKEVKGKEEIYEGKWVTLKYKEEELSRRESEISVLTESMEQQKQFLVSLKDEMKDPQAMAKLNEQLQQLKGELRLKEEQLRDREILLNSKFRELEIKEMEMASSRFDAYDLPETATGPTAAGAAGGTSMQASRAGAAKSSKLVVKIKSGAPRLDDLLFGGFPAGSNVLLSGPSFIGKETLCNLFIAEGLNRSVPCLYITIDENYTKIMGHLAEMTTNCESCEKGDFIKYIDMYTIRTNPSLLSVRHPDNIEFLDNLRDTEALSMAIKKALDIFIKKGKYYRVVFPISTLLLNMDPMTLIKFLEPINARVKSDSSVALYTVNPGLHAERDVEMVRHIMDGTIDFKLTDTRKSLSINGISNVQTRSWIEYNNTETNLIIGSFTVEKIK